MLGSMFNIISTRLKNLQGFETLGGLPLTRSRQLYRLFTYNIPQTVQ